MAMKHRDWSRSKTVGINGNQRNQSMVVSTRGHVAMREKFGIKVPFIRDEKDITVQDYPFSVDPLMAGDAILANCCRMCPDNFELEMLPEVKTWLKEDDMDVRFSVYFGIFHFQSDEDKVKFILKWL